MTRPFESTSSDASCLASTTACRCGRMMTPVASRMRVVCAARKGLGDSAIQRLLATKDVAILATVQADGAPLAMPMWFLHDPASLTMISVEGTHKVRNLRRDARVCVVAEAGSGGGDERGVT